MSTFDGFFESFFEFALLVFRPIAAPGAEAFLTAEVDGFDDGGAFFLI